MTSSNRRSAAPKIRTCGRDGFLHPLPERSNEFLARFTRYPTRIVCADPPIRAVTCDAGFKPTGTLRRGADQ